jgi:tetratricopeptide (TPR) repeat protein
MPSREERTLLVDAATADSLLTFAVEAAPRVGSLDAKSVFGELEHRYSDLLLAMRWFIDERRTDNALRLVSALAQFWTATKRLDDGATWSSRALASPGGDDAHRGRALFDAGLMAFWQGDDDRASALHNQALEIGRQIGSPTISALALSGLARIALRSGDVGAARRLCREALAVTEGTEDRVGRSSALHVLGVVAQMAGDFVEAREMMSARIALARAQGNYVVISIEANNLSMVERQLGNLEQADALAREALDIAYQRGDEWAMPFMLSGIAAVATERRDFARAAMLVGAAEAMIEAQGAAWPPDERPHYERMMATLLDAMGAAEFDRCRAAGRAMSSREAAGFALADRSAG